MTAKDAKPCHVFSKIFTLHELIKCLLHIRRDKKKTKTNTFLNVICFTRGVYFRFSFMLPVFVGVFLVVVFPPVYIILSYLRPVF